MEVLACRENPFREQHLVSLTRGVSSPYPKPEPIFVTLRHAVGPKAILPPIDAWVAWARESRSINI